MTDLVVVDADVLGRERTGDETYVRNLLRELPPVAADAGLRVAAATRHPELVPEDVETYELHTSMQELRMSWSLPRLLRRAGAALVHTQYAVPVRCPCPAVVTVHDLSFERDPSSMSARDRAVFRWAVPRAVRCAARVVTVSQRSRADIVDLYGADPDRVVVTPNGVDPAFHPGEVEERGYVLCVGAIQRRKDQPAALAAAHEAGLELVVVGPTRDRALAEDLRRGGARLEGYVDIERLAELYRGAACLVQASRYEGFGLPVLEAMASGTPVVTVPDAALVEVVGGAGVVVEPGRLADGIREALVHRDRLAWAGLERARAFSWRATAEATVAVYRAALAA